MSLSVEINGMAEFVDDVSRAGGDAEPLVRGAIFNSATRTQSTIRQNAPHRTGALQQRILADISSTSATVTAEESYAVYVEEGTKPHDIAPKNKKALYWTGAFSPVKAVHHPGTKANPFFTRGVGQAASYIQEQFNSVAERLIRILAGSE